MGAMILNLSANALGLGNAATPFGIRAMQELDKLNSQPGTATNAMVLFLAINTSSVTLLPTGVIALRAAAGSADPAAILPTTLLATIGSTTVAILAARLYSRLSAAPPPLAPGSSPVAMPDADADPALAEDRPLPLWASVLALATLVSLVPVAVLYGQALSPWIIPGLMVLFLGFGALRRVRVYEVMVEGGREGFQVALRIIPYMVVILVGVAMLRASGLLELVVGALGRFTAPLGLPAEALPMALMRPLSGSGARTATPVCSSPPCRAPPRPPSTCLPSTSARFRSNGCATPWPRPSPPTWPAWCSRCSPAWCCSAAERHAQAGLSRHMKLRLVEVPLIGLRTSSSVSRFRSAAGSTSPQPQASRIMPGRITSLMRARISTAPFGVSMRTRAPSSIR
jgi:spore maturation protein SpmA